MFNVDDTFRPLNLKYFANWLTFLVSSHNLNITRSVGSGSNTVFLSQLFGKRERHNFPVNAERCIEMPFIVPAVVRSYRGLNQSEGPG